LSEHLFGTGVVFLVSSLTAAAEFVHRMDQTFGTSGPSTVSMFIKPAIFGISPAD
jgi:hypothetical protein